MTRRRLRIWAMGALLVAVVLFVSTVKVLQWAAVVLVLVSILVLTWTLFTTERREAP